MMDRGMDFSELVFFLAWRAIKAKWGSAEVQLILEGKEGKVAVKEWLRVAVLEKVEVFSWGVLEEREVVVEVLFWGEEEEACGGLLFVNEILYASSPLCLSVCLHSHLH
ncbi:hypothetical protein TcasGA2_TC032468 [Tribolium castaneum]|uniref:Uncharacterized protein n=1 Tax=Tribolium castaneum TaxID=7070 RepID=A0A139WLA1_TRICA|nr:hypothetical protein TcasGA2_TC032468 [Tribolium castaneum]